MGTEVHHKIHLTADNINDASVTLNWDNLELLCKECHDIAHRSGRRYSVGPDGKVEDGETDVR